MTPYYEQDGITIFHGDCRDVLGNLAQESADLLLTDPPYGVDWQSGQRATAWGPIFGDAEGTDWIPSA